MLGGRSEVVNAPAIELMKYMEMTMDKDINKKKEKQAEMYISYLSNIFSQQLQEKPSAGYLKAKKDFESLLIPEKEGKKKESKKYEWDFDPEEYLESKSI